MSKIRLIREILKEKLGQKVKKSTAYAFAPANIALCKYWGKRDQELHLPVTDSLSVSLADKGSKTRLTVDSKDSIILNGEPVDLNEVFAIRLFNFINLFRLSESPCFKVEIECNIPIAAGLASSAAGFAALALALNEIYEWNLSKRELSILSRIGSGSASRSVYNGFVIWHKGTGALDSYAEPINEVWPDLCLGLLINSHTKKIMPSTKAMEITQKTSAFYSLWPDKVKSDIEEIQKAIKEKDFVKFGEIAEHNAVTMHALMLTAKPSIDYMNVDTIADIKTVKFCREKLGLPVYYTQDAGHNLKLIFQEKHLSKVKAQFPNLEVVRPFSYIEQLVEN